MSEMPSTITGAKGVDQGGERGDPPSTMNAAASLPLQTMHCVNCDYSLEGLPRDAKCPECGTGIDDRFVVIRGRARQGSRTDSAIWLMLLFNVLCVSGRSIFDEPLRWLFGDKFGSGLWTGALIFAGGWIGVVYLWRWFDLDGPPYRLWISDRGFFVCDRRQLFQSAHAHRVLWRATVILAAIMVVRIAVSGPLYGLIALATFALVALLVRKVEQSFRRDTVVEDAPGIGRQRFMSWQTLVYARVEKITADRWSLEIRPLPPTFFSMNRYRGKHNWFKFHATLNEAMSLDSYVRDRMRAVSTG